MRHSPLLILVLSSLILLSACQRERPAGIPPAPTGSATVTTLPAPTVVATPTAVATSPVAEPITSTVVLTATAPATATVTLEAVALQPLRIRSGPGLEYPIIGDLAATARVAVIGRSTDDAWLQIECPAGVAAQPCWIIGDASFWQFDEVVAALPTAPAPPLPTPLPTPTAPPCVIAPPSGWTAYAITAGDTLSGLASRFGANIDQLQRVNCLSSDVIVAGASLYVPATGAAPAGDAGSAAPPAGAPLSPAPLSLVAAKSILFKAPNVPTSGCLNRNVPNNPSQPLRINTSSLGPAFTDTFVVTDWLCIYIANLDPAQSVDVKLTQPGREDLRPNPPSTGENAWSLVLAPDVALTADQTSATWAIEVAQGMRRAEPKAITVSRAQNPTLRVVTRSVAPGGQVQAVAAGWPAQTATALYLYRLDGPAEDRSWMLERALPSMLSNANGEAIYTVTMGAQDAPGCFLLHTGEEDPDGANRYDRRVFAVGISPEQCR